MINAGNENSYINYNGFFRVNSVFSVSFRSFSVFIATRFFVFNFFLLFGKCPTPTRNKTF